MPVENNQITFPWRKLANWIHSSSTVFLPAYAMVPGILLSLQLLPISRCITLSVVFLFLTQFSYTIFSSSPSGQCYTVLNSIFHDRERSYGTGFFFFDKFTKQICFDTYRQNNMVLAVSIRLCETIPLSVGFIPFVLALILLCSWQTAFLLYQKKSYSYATKACLNSSARPGFSRYNKKELALLFQSQFFSCNRTFAEKLNPRS